MNDSNRIVLIECCNYIDFPAGGQLSFAKNLMNAFGSDLILVGITTDDTPVGVWVKKEFNGIEYDFISLGKVLKSNKKPIIPYRLFSYFIIKRHKQLLLKYKKETFFIQAPEVLLAVKDWGLSDICYRFAGVNNPIGQSRYWYATAFAKIFETIFYKSFRNVRTIFASSNLTEIATVEKQIQQIYPDKTLIQLFTRVDTTIFRPNDKVELRKKYKIALDKRIIIYTGRLANIKGWKFLIDSFLEFLKFEPDSIFFLIGDGEDKLKVDKYIADNQANDYICLLGQLSPVVISDYLNMADLFIMASFKEGWSTALVEAASCGLPACVTNFSSSKEIITHTINGYIVEERDSKLFGNFMQKALLLNTIEFDSEKYSINTLKEDILKHLNTDNEKKD